MNVEEIKSLKISGKVFEVRAGRALTTIDLMPNGKSIGKDIIIRNDEELDDLISSLQTIKEWLNKTFEKPAATAK